MSDRNFSSTKTHHMMKGVISTGYGSPEVLQIHEIPIPTPKKNEVRIKIHAASVTRADTMMRTGKPYIGRLFLGLTKPKHAIGGTGFAGVIDSLGEEVKLFKKGDRVFGENVESLGTHAEYVCIPEDGLISLVPAKMSFQEAAVICDGAITSMNFLKNVGSIQNGQKVLINGASGSLGTSAVQLAKYLGAEVTGVCSSANMDLVKSLGADKVIDYTNQDITANTDTYDIIYDTVGMSSYSNCKKALTENGVYVSPVLGLPLLFDMIYTSIFGKKKAKFSATGLLPIPELKILLHETIKIIELGKLKSIMDKTYPIEQITDAHRYIDKGHKRGNVVINICEG